MENESAGHNMGIESDSLEQRVERLEKEVVELRKVKEAFFFLNQITVQSRADIRAIAEELYTLANQTTRQYGKI